MKKKEHSRKLFLIIVVLALIIILSAIAAFYFFSRDKIEFAPPSQECVTNNDCPICNSCMYLATGAGKPAVGAMAVVEGKDTKGICVYQCKDTETCCTNIASHGACEKTNNDNHNCGSCGNVCPGTTVCIDGKCGCPQEQVRCGDFCVNTNNDQYNCGKCGNICGNSKICVNGECECRSDSPDCNGDGFCDSLNSYVYCGSCDVHCWDKQECVNGECICPQGGELCDGLCVHTDYDELYCGSCDVHCNKGEECVNGQCI